MKKFAQVLFFIFSLFPFISFSQTIYSTKTGELSFSSQAPLENIEATNKKVGSVIKTATNDILFFVSIKNFQFEKELMQEHFNENYMESDKYPDATFKGKINETIDFTKNGTYQITATGKLKIHGVEQDRTEKGILTVKDSTITIHCEMKMKVKDFNIEIPKLVFQNIAEVVDVKLNAIYTPYKK